MRKTFQSVFHLAKNNVRIIKHLNTPHCLSLFLKLTDIYLKKVRLWNMLKNKQILQYLSELALLKLAVKAVQGYHVNILKFFRNCCKRIQGRFYFSYYQITRYFCVKGFFTLFSYTKKTEFLGKKMGSVLRRKKRAKKVDANYKHLQNFGKAVPIKSFQKIESKISINSE